MNVMIQRAWDVAAAAHGACGQKRADGRPYISHPEAVVHILERRYIRRIPNLHEMEKPNAWVDMMSAAYLHDVVEDTKLTLYDLDRFGFSDRTLNLVDLLTKRDSDAQESLDTYARIKEDILALHIKAADRVSNLRDATLEVEKGRSFKRWKKYAEKTHLVLRPHFEGHPELYQEVNLELTLLETAITKAQA